MATFRIVVLALLVGYRSAERVDKYGNPCQTPAPKELTPGAKAGIGLTVAAAALGGSIAAVESNENAKETAENTFDDAVRGAKKVFSKKNAEKVLTSIRDKAKKVFNLSHAITLPNSTAAAIAAAPLPHGNAAAITVAPLPHGNAAAITVAPPPPPPPHAKMSAQAMKLPPPPPHAKMSAQEVKTVTSAAVEAGATELPVTNQAGFEVGQVVVIGAGTALEEKKRIVGFGSLLFDSPLKFAHAQGVTVDVDVAPKPLDSSASSSGTSASLGFSNSGFLNTGSSAEDSFGSEGSSGFTASGSSGFYMPIWVWLGLVALLGIGIVICSPFKKPKKKIKRATGPLSARHVSRTASAEHAAYPAAAFESALEQAPLMAVLPPKLEVASASLRMPQLPPFYQVTPASASASYAPVTTSAPVTASAPVTTSYVPPSNTYMTAAQPAMVLATTSYGDGVQRQCPAMVLAPSPVMAAPMVMDRVANSSTTSPRFASATSPSIGGFAAAPAMMGGFATPPASGGFAAPAMMGGSVTPPVPGGFAAPAMMGGSVTPPVPGGIAAPVVAGFVTPPVAGGAA